MTLRDRFPALYAVAQEFLIKSPNDDSKEFVRELIADFENAESEESRYTIHDEILLIMEHG